MVRLTVTFYHDGVFVGLPLEYVEVGLGNGGNIDLYVEHHGYDILGEEEVIIPNRCTSDPFLNRLCKIDHKKTTRNTFGTNERDANALVEDEIEDQSVDPIYKGNGKEKVTEDKGKEKVVEGSKAVEGNKKCTKQGIKLSKSPCKEKAVKGNMKWTKQVIKLSKSPSEKGTKRKTSDNV
ncbi:hypothetical protein Tco_0986378, partial [Tanacetum coccineum]